MGDDNYWVRCSLHSLEHNIGFGLKKHVAWVASQPVLPYDKKEKCLWCNHQNPVKEMLCPVHYRLFMLMIDARDEEYKSHL